MKSGTPEPDGRPYRVSFHREVAKIVAQHGVDSSLFRPTIGELITALENNPKQFEKKRGELKEARAAEVRFSDGVTWRAVFVIDEDRRLVRVLALGPHDAAYAEAKRRI